MTAAPVTLDTHRSSVSTKIFLIIGIFSVPIGVLAYLLAANYTPQIAVAQLELSGNSMQKPLMKALYGSLSSHNLLQGCDSGGCAADLSKQSALIGEALEAVRSQNAQLGSDLKTTSDDLAKKNHKDLTVESLQSEWKALAAGTNISASSSRADLAGGYGRLAGHIKQLIGYVGDTSNLILDPDLDSYYLVDVTLLATPEMFTQIASAASTAYKLIDNSGTAVDQAELVNQSALLQQSLERTASSNRTSFDADAANHGVSPTLQPKLQSALQQYQATMAGYLTALKTAQVAPSQITVSALAAEAAAAQKASFDYWNSASAELDILLAVRTSDFEASRMEALGFSALAVLLAAIIAFLLGRSITKPLQALVRNLAPGATLLGASVDLIAEASQRQTPSAEESAIICEELNAHADNMRKAVLELARQVEGSAAANRMVTESTARTQG